MTKQKIDVHRQAIFNGVAAIGAGVLTAYTLHAWARLPESLNFGAAGWTLLLIAAVMGLVSIVYGTLAYLMRFCCNFDIPLKESKVIRVLYYDEPAENLLLVRYANRFWITKEA